jgi:glycosyltransferase involved in cell wall biosynthesis
MHVLMIHQAFPAQFGRLALELQRRYGWKCTFLVESLSNCPSPAPEMLTELELHPLQLPPEFREQPLTPWPRSFGRSLTLCEAVYNGVQSLPDCRPDLVVAHGPDGMPLLFLPELLECPLVSYCEYYFAREHCDLSYRVDLPPVEPAEFFPRTINAIALVNLAAGIQGYSPTRWQRDSFPARFHPRIEVHFDGIDTELYQRRSGPRRIAGRDIPDEMQIVTFVARGLESMRGFDIFMRVAQRVARERPNVLFAVAGSDRTFYGWDQISVGTPHFKQWVLDHGDFDLSRFLFLGHIEPTELAALLSLSDVHLYLTVPFVLSWSLFNALSCGCVVIGSDVAPVREVIEPGVNGLVEPLFDIDRLTEATLKVLDDPAEFAPLAAAGRRTIEERYSLEVAIPELKDYFERMANRARPKE